MVKEFETFTGQFTKTTEQFKSEILFLIGLKEVPLLDEEDHALIDCLSNYLGEIEERIKGSLTHAFPLTASGVYLERFSEFFGIKRSEFETDSVLKNRLETCLAGRSQHTSNKLRREAFALFPDTVVDLKSLQYNDINEKDLSPSDLLERDKFKALGRGNQSIWVMFDWSNVKDIDVLRLDIQHKLEEIIDGDFYNSSIIVKPCYDRTFEITKAKFWNADQLEGFFVDLPFSFLHKYTNHTGLKIGEAPDFGWFTRMRQDYLENFISDELKQSEFLDFYSEDLLDILPKDKNDFDRHFSSHSYHYVPDERYAGKFVPKMLEGEFGDLDCFRLVSKEKFLELQSAQPVQPKSEILETVDEDVSIFKPFDSLEIERLLSCKGFDWLEDFDSLDIFFKFLSKNLFIFFENKIKKILDEAYFLTCTNERLDKLGLLISMHRQPSEIDEDFRKRIKTNMISTGGGVAFIKHILANFLITGNDLGYPFVDTKIKNLSSIKDSDFSAEQLIHKTNNSNVVGIFYSLNNYLHTDFSQMIQSCSALINNKIDQYFFGLKIKFIKASIVRYDLDSVYVKRFGYVPFSNTKPENATWRLFCTDVQKSIVEKTNRSLAIGEQVNGADIFRVGKSWADTEHGEDEGFGFPLTYTFVGLCNKERDLAFFPDISTYKRFFFEHTWVDVKIKPYEVVVFGRDWQ